jgi:hypothetical protein
MQQTGMFRAIAALQAELRCQDSAGGLAEVTGWLEAGERTADGGGGGGGSAVCGDGVRGASV